MSHEDALRFFAQNSDPRAIALKGRWGSGKTFYWKKRVIPEYFASATLRRTRRGHAYASLYGVESVQQLKNSLAFSYIENSSLSLFRATCQYLLNKLRSLSKNLDRYLGDETTIGNRGSNLKLKSKLLLNDAAFLSIRDTLICLDYIERRNKSLSIGDVLGLVNYLVEHRKCRVVVILNFDSLDQKEVEDWEKGKDKTFTSEVSFMPSIEDSIDIGLKGSEHEKWHSTVRKCLIRLEIGNVRVVSRVKNFVHQLISSIRANVANAPPESLDSIVMTATLLATLHSSRATGAPDIFEVMESPRFLGKSNEEDELTEEQKLWNERISNYFGMHFGDQMDLAIARSLADGYPRLDLLAPAITDWLDLHKRELASEKFSKAWRTYHDTLKDNEDEIFNAFSEAIPGILNTEGVHNIEPTGRILRLTGHPEVTTALFRDWVALRKSPERVGELDGLEHFGYKVTDPEFIRIIDEAKNDVAPTQLSLHASLKKIDSGEIDAISIKALAIASPEEILDILTKNDGDWRRCMKTIVMHGLPGEDAPNARLNFLKALRLICEQSDLGADRIRNKVGEIDFKMELD